MKKKEGFTLKISKGQFFYYLADIFIKIVSDKSSNLSKSCYLQNSYTLSEYHLERLTSPFFLRLHPPLPKFS